MPVSTQFSATIRTHTHADSEFGTEAWIGVHRAAHRLGMRTSASILFGAGESFEQRIDSLEALRSLQEETEGFAAFAPWSYRAGKPAEEATAVEYLKVLAISRLYLDNIDNVQSSWAAQGLKVLQMGLRFGGNDVGSVTPEEDAAKSTTEEELRRIIREAGFKPVQRDALYRTVFLN
jgi:cyclic dehypoxanthinyl futalosine synthase